MQQQGWIKIHRQLIEWEWYDDLNTFKVFIHCLLRANHKEKIWQGKTIKVGSFITSYSNLASECKISVQQLRTSLEKLKITKSVTIKATNKFTIVSVCKYASYQVLDAEKTKQVTSKTTNQQQTNNKQITTTNNDNKENNDNKQKSFISFWNKYPKKVAKDKCKSIFLKLKQTEIDIILKTIDSFIAFKPFKDYTHPNPTTYLNQKRWTDEIEAVNKPNVVQSIKYETYTR